MDVGALRLIGAPGSMTTIREVGPSTAAYDVVLQLAEVLDQKRYVVREYPHAKQRIMLGAFDDVDRPVGFLFTLVQVLGEEEGRSPVVLNGKVLLESYVEAFGVLPELRRMGIGQALQETAIQIASALGCYQIRSRTPFSARENYALKLKMGYAIHPSNENDSYYFIRKL
jgi:GNAT superfamily N-acetyltransferase